MATLTISDNKLRLWTSSAEDMLARQVRGGRRRESFWEHDFSLEKVDNIKKVFSDVLIDEAVKVRIRKEHARRIKLLHIKRMKNCKIEVPLKTKPYPFQRVGIKYMLEALRENF